MIILDASSPAVISAWLIEFFTALFIRAATRPKFTCCYFFHSIASLLAGLMNISMLLDIDDLGGNIASALRSNPDIRNLSSDSALSSWVLKGRPYLHPMTNIDPSPSLRHPDSWDFPARPLIIKPWVGKASSNGYETLPDANITAHPNTFDRPPGLAYYPPVPADMTKLELLPEHSSSQQSCDEDWRKYLADEPFSNGMDDDGLDLDAARSTLEFTYPPPDKVEDANTPSYFASEQLSFSAVPNFPTHSSTGLFDSTPLAENPLSTISPVSRPLLVIPSPEHTSFAVDIQEDTPRRNDTVCIPNGTYASLMELTPPAFDFGSARFSSLEAPSHPSAASVHVSPASSPIHSPQRRGRSPTVSRRGLSGWGDSQYLQVPTPAVIIGRCKKRVRSPTNSPCSSTRRPYTVSPLSLIQDSEETTSTHDSKRSKTSQGFSSRTLRSVSVARTKVVEPGSDPEELVAEDDSDSDDYRPSRSSSIDPGVSSSFSAAPLLPDVRPVLSKQRSTLLRRGKGKAKGSAALALAVVTQLGAGAKGHVKSEPRDDGDDYDPLTLYREGRYGIRKKKNNPIPLPVPVPNLNKKSRGRKVPYVAASAAVIKVEEDRSPSAEVSTEDQGSASSVVADSTDSKNSGRSRRKRARVPTPVASIDQAGNRTYVCAVAGCGKCFVRGEHLKRHIRSIHTYDKRKFLLLSFRLFY